MKYNFNKSMIINGLTWRQKFYPLTWGCFKSETPAGKTLRELQNFPGFIIRLKKTPDWWDMLHAWRVGDKNILVWRSQRMRTLKWPWNKRQYQIKVVLKRLWRCTGLSIGSSDLSREDINGPEKFHKRRGILWRAEQLSGAEKLWS